MRERGLNLLTNGARMRQSLLRQGLISLFCKVAFGSMRSFFTLALDAEVRGRNNEVIVKRSPDGGIDEEIYNVARGGICHIAI